MRSARLSELPLEEHASVQKVMESAVKDKLMVMGFLPGVEVILRHVAPLGDPLMFEIGGHYLGLRKHEARSIIITY